MTQKSNTIVSIITLSLIYALSCIFKLSANIVMPIFQDRFSLSSSITGFITGSYYFLYAPMQFLAGPLCHRWNTHKVVSTLLLASSVGSLLTAFATNGYMVLLGRVLIGLGVGPVYISTVYYVYTKTTSKLYPIAIGITMTIGNIGAVVSSAPLKKAIDIYGITATFIIMAILLVFGSIILFILDILSKDNNSHTVQKESVIDNLKQGLLYMSKSPMLIMGTFMWLMFNSFQLTYQGLWSAKWFISAYPNLTNIAPWSATFASIGLAISTLVAEPLRNKKNPRYKSTIISEFMFVAMGYITVFSHHLTNFGITSHTAITVIVLLLDYMLGHAMGCLCLMLTAITREKTDSTINANVMGIMNGVGSVSCIFFQWLTGRLYDIFSKTHSPNISYSIVFTIMSTIVLVVAIFTSYTQIKGR